MMQAANPSNPIHRISVEQYHRLIAASVFDDADRVELIDGEMRDMSPIGPLHGGTTNNLNMLFASRLAGKAIVSVQGPLVIDEDTELYPDLLILKPRDDWYRASNPTGDDVFLAIEVADSSLSIDLGTKLEKFARAGVRRYWVVDLPNRIVHDHRDPDRFGRRFRQLHSVRDGSVTATIEGVDVSISVNDLF